jgi:glyoxylase-like metal-dependent hydrolase (beta-lactamase superfamily II)
VEVTQIAPGLWRWTGVHPDWTPDEGGPDGWDREVGCVYYEAPEAVVLVDPLVPPEDPDRFWAALDRDVERAARPVAVFLTIFWHQRSTQEIVERYGASVWAHPQPPHRMQVAVTNEFEFGATLPGDVTALEANRGGETIYWIAPHRALVPGDVLLGTAEGGVRVCPDSWLAEDFRGEELRRALRPLLDLPVERIVLSHGEPVLEGAHTALARALA